ncbi:hypothetical protein HLB23_39320 [Nocardia uniformis]|uniref:Uncharacterized protein n=1 Tax=Nocardia uniformis TaxID=53432 RepID=A0A849CDE0_9NOCA|nr:hypothetical protein [Nocardia uniformis]NNH75838.1 hypothetical protein [Nocardia uniformis]
MTIDTTVNNGELFVALISHIPPASVRSEIGFEPFDTMDAARTWAGEKVNEWVTRCGAAWQFRGDIARVSRADFDADHWGVADGNTVARVNFDSDTKTMVWQNYGPFEFSEWDDDFGDDNGDDNDM